MTTRIPSRTDSLGLLNGLIGFTGRPPDGDQAGAHGSETYRRSHPRAAYCPEALRATAVGEDWESAMDAAGHVQDQDDAQSAPGDASPTWVRLAFRLAFGIVAIGVTVFLVLVTTGTVRAGEGVMITFKLMGGLCVIGATASTLLKTGGGREVREWLKSKL
ncbi:hypothetical protein [Streptomyces ehimensis]|uniref:Uncharacterized protein n=2 Tax=Streptomyces TaxID=1883 RepID=A0ABV9BLC4_9ACTN